MTTLSIVWFRQDLRLKDNPALTAASQRGDILPVYILEDADAGKHKAGAASRWWLHHSLEALNQQLFGQLHLACGNALDVLLALIRQTGASAVFWNRCYEPWRIQRDTEIKQALQAIGITAESSNSALLWEPWQVLTKSGTPYKVFTPFYRKGCLQAPEPAAPLDAPASLRLHSTLPDSLSLIQLKLLPKQPWDAGFKAHWQVGEEAARIQLDLFISERFSGYHQQRDYPASGQVSRLSPHLHFGEISPRTLWHSTLRAAPALGVTEEDLDCFLKELAWREFSYYLLYHFPTLPAKNFQPRFDRFNWETDSLALKRWQTGQTGYPIIDAGMQELWRTGYMHNRVRMLVGSFLVKNLLCHWQTGQAWFWDCLLDADLASNSASWQWIAGCGADAAPYFRIFNPITQSKRFDPQGEYIRTHLPQLANLPDKYIHSPWDAPEAILADAGVTLGQNYPLPIVDLSTSRQRALSRYQTSKE